MRKISQDLKSKLLRAAGDCQAVYDRPDLVTDKTDIGIRFFQDPWEMRVAFRGTVPSDKKNIKDDVEVLQVPWRGLSVHEGFSRAADDCLPVVVQKIKTWLTKTKLPDTTPRIVLEGHSLGAAVATLLLWSLVDENLLRAENIWVFALESPRVMGPRSERLYDSYYRSRVIRTRNDQDVITHLPPALLDYRHVGTPVYLGSPWALLRSIRGDQSSWSHFLPNVRSGILSLPTI